MKQLIAASVELGTVLVVATFVLATVVEDLVPEIVAVVVVFRIFVLFP